MNKLSMHDDILEGITFDELITTIQCNEYEVNAATIKQVFNDLLSRRIDEARDMLNENIQFIRDNV